MKNKIILFALLLASVFTYANADKPQTVKIKTSAICEMCKERIEKKLAFTKGVTDVNLDIDSKEKVVTVMFNDKKTSVEKIKKAIAEVGYDADEIKADQVGYDKLPGCCKKGGHME